MLRISGSCAEALSKIAASKAVSAKIRIARYFMISNLYHTKVAFGRV